MRPIFFLREALRALKRNAIPSFAAMATVLVTVLVLGVFLPVVQATTGAANEVRSKVIADVYLKADVKQADIDRVERLLQGRAAGRQRRVHLQGAGLPGPSASATRRRTTLLGSNPLPDTFRVTPTKPGRHRQAQGRARAAGARAAGRRSSTPRSTRSATARRTRTRSSRSRAW